MKLRAFGWVTTAVRSCSVVRVSQFSLAISLMCVLMVASANAAPFAYVVTLSQQFGIMDLANGKFQPIGNGTPDSLNNLVWWGDGSLRTLTTFPTLGSLAKINPATGEEKVIGATGLNSNAFDLAKVHRTLYLTDFSNNLYSVDARSGVATTDANTVIPPDPNIPLSFNSDGTFNLCDEGLYGIGGRLYATFDSYAIDPTQTPPRIVHEYVSPRVYAVDPFTGATTVIANTDWQLSAIFEADEKVYAFKVVIDGFDWNFDVPIAHAELVRLDLKTGHTSKIADIDPSLGPIFGAAPIRHETARE